MAKITKKQYNEIMTRLEAQLEATKKEWKELAETVTPENADNLRDTLNALADREYELEQEIKSLEREWDTRNWTLAEWTSYNLIANNVD